MLEELDKAWAKRMPATTWQTRLGNVQRQPKEQRPFPLPMYARFAHVCVCVCGVYTHVCGGDAPVSVWIFAMAKFAFIF